MVNIHVLCTELSLDAIGLVMGTIVLIRSSDNKLQRAWGFLAITLSILLLLDNTEWVYLYGKGGKGLPDRAILYLIIYLYGILCVQLYSSSSSPCSPWPR